MDKIIRITLGLFIVIFAGFSGILSYNAYVEHAYRSSITGTFMYTCTISTDSPLSNVTLFIPVPTDKTGNSPMVSEFSSNTMQGVPPAWETTLFDTGKATMLKVVTPAVLPPEGTTPANPYTITFSSETVQRSRVMTKDPIGAGVMFRPVQGLNESGCATGKIGRCFTYTTSLFADYSTSANATVTITSAVSGRNNWTIFEPRSNEYTADIRISMSGSNHGWMAPAGRLAAGIGSYDSFVDA